MEIGGIIFLSLVVLWLILDIVRDSFKNKWYRRGYINACHKYDKFEHQPKDGYGEEADKEWYNKHGFHYD
jgi:hypothetical protein